MSKIRRGGHSAEGEPLSAGRVEYLEAARARVRTRRIRRTVIIVAVLTILVLFATGAVGSSIARAKDLVDTAVITLAPAPGWPQQTGITDPDAVAQMSGSFVEMGGDSCVVYSLGGTRLNSIQSGYARPALAAGKTFDDFTAETHMVAEGAYACRSLDVLAKRYRVELPITDLVRSIVWEGVAPEHAARALVGRPLTTEFYGL